MDGSSPDRAARDFDEGHKHARRFRSLFRNRYAVAGMLLGIAGIATVGAATSYHRFYHHTTALEVSHVVEHTTFEMTLRGSTPVTLQLYQRANTSGQALVLLTSGDGGWSPFCADIAADIASTGKTVVGFDAKTYLTAFASSQKPVTPEELVRDYGDILNAALARAGLDQRSPVTLCGWSLGAGYSVLVATDASLKTRVLRVVAISLPELNELAWKPADALIYVTHGVPHEKVFNSGDYLARLAPVHLVMLNATDDDTSPLTPTRKLFDLAATSKQFYAVQAKGHHFEGGEATFYSDLEASL
jgi:pimeloyl-ACP methyl ester carboxylesterase